MRRVIIIEFDMKFLKVPQVLFMNIINKLFGADTGLPGAYHNRCAVSVVCTEIEALIAAKFLKSHPDIRLEIFHKVTDMYGAVRIRQG